jgi:hypothetical protein
MCGSWSIVIENEKRIITLVLKDLELRSVNWKKWSENKFHIGLITLFSSVCKDQTDYLGCAPTGTPFLKRWTTHCPWPSPYTCVAAVQTWARARLGPDWPDSGQSNTFVNKNFIFYIPTHNFSEIWTKFLSIKLQNCLDLIYFLTFTSILKNRLITNKYLIFLFIKYFFSKINVKSLNRDILTTKF